MFDSVLVANRGEIAVRVCRTLRRLGIASVAVYSDADRRARHVAAADLAVRLGAAPARESYLNIERILEVAASAGVDAIHPGYGFLAENATFARRCAEAGVTFIGPSPRAIEVMGDKVLARRTVAAAGVPVVPGRGEPAMTDELLRAAAEEVGFPVILKPAAGGGGKGMHIASSPAELSAAIPGARREALGAFGDDTLFIERYVPRARHIEVQVVADALGTVDHLGERECSLQRRHQKVVEEAPSPGLDAALRERLAAAAIAAARSVEYCGVGTVEFIVPAGGVEEFFFIEMNTRLQVEHPVTELVTGLDLVELQVRVAAGEPLAIRAGAGVPSGHAVEARVYAESPARGFLPTTGTVVALREPDGEGVRVDSSLFEGLEVSADYDAMLAKVVAFAPRRAEALLRLRQAISRTVILGLETNLSFLTALLEQPDVVSGRLDTGLIEREMGALADAEVPLTVYAAFGAAMLEEAIEGRPDGPWQPGTAWRLLGSAPLRFTVAVDGGHPVRLSVTGSVDDALLEVGDEQARVALTRIDGQHVLTVDDAAHPLVMAKAGSELWVHVDGRTRVVREVLAERALRAESARDEEIASPLPGTVIEVRVRSGAPVVSGETLVVVEAMKMEHRLEAPDDGIVEILVREGESVALGAVVARIRPRDDDADDGADKRGV